MKVLKIIQIDALSLLTENWEIETNTSSSFRNLRVELVINKVVESQEWELSLIKIWKIGSKRRNEVEKNNKIIYLALYLLYFIAIYLTFSIF